MWPCVAGRQGERLFFVGPVMKCVRSDAGHKKVRPTRKLGSWGPGARRPTHAAARVAREPLHAWLLGFDANVECLCTSAALVAEYSLAVGHHNCTPLVQHTPHCKRTTTSMLLQPAAASAASAQLQYGNVMANLIWLLTTSWIAYSRTQKSSGRSSTKTLRIQERSWARTYSGHVEAAAEHARRACRGKGWVRHQTRVW